MNLYFSLPQVTFFKEINWNCRVFNICLRQLKNKNKLQKVKQQRIHKEGDCFHFFMYSLYSGTSCSLRNEMTVSFPSCHVCISLQTLTGITGGRGQKAWKEHTVKSPILFCGATCVLSYKN